MFRIIEVREDQVLSEEQMGTKEKFWFLDHSSGHRWLYKHARINKDNVTGEDWAEKAASEIARHVGIPTATVELATFDGRPGIASLDFTRSLAGTGRKIVSSMLHGNELLHRLSDAAYPLERSFRIAEHTVDRVLDVLDNPVIFPPAGFECPSPISTASDMFVGYLALDALIGNTDRHHQNWAIQYIPTVNDERLFLCPSFDHASSLGRELTERRRESIINSADRKTMITKYIQKAPSAMYAAPGDQQPLSPCEAFWLACKRRQEAGRYWMQRIAELTDIQIVSVFQDFPPERVTVTAKEMAATIISENRARLLDAEGAGR